jgi:N-acetylmuramoyl-L-alanine amidase
LRLIPGTAAKTQAVGQRGTYEKTVTLRHGRKLKRMIDAEFGMRAMLTRDDDYVPSRACRRPAASKPTFQSIHADAFASRGRGARRVRVVRKRRDELGCEMARAWRTRPI